MLKLSFVFCCLVAGLPGQTLWAQTSAGQTSRWTTLRVMTYNIHHANPPSRAKDSLIDLAAIARVINTAKPDLVALQEIDVHNSRAGVGVDEAAELGRLTGMHWYFTRAIDYRGGEYGDAVLSRFPIIDTLRFELPMPAGIGGETRDLCVIRVRLADNRPLLFASTHLDQRRDETARLLQAQTLAGIVRKFKEPFILGGDLNAYPESRTLQVMDSVLTRSCTTGCPLTIPVDPPKKTIDYILFTPAARFESLGVRTIAETYASDHLPVMAELRY
ncbi:endonuclease/exonuclease/phosphatase family protein [Puia sp.]|jgi:endonuclease/exonuclease/phosphatase family metal-dependent hydrolase|uniref:endonuclease/exonuclease/phosphatase family protein n=1 Tax=Puia sp. TaxID=2045100 RepID=UPI002F411628